MNENNVPAGMPLMCEAFRTCYSSGAGGPFVMEFKFKSLADLHAADDEWLAARATAPVAQPPATAEAVARSKHLAWLRDQTDHWIGNRKARRDEALAALATQPLAPVQQSEAWAWVVCSSFTGNPVFPPRYKREDAERDAYSIKTPTEIRALYTTPPAPATALPPVAMVPEPVARVLRFAGKARNEVSNPCLTAREAIVVANWMVAHGIKADTKGQGHE